MSARLFFALILPPLLWGSNAIIGKLAAGVIPPVTLNVLRWATALVVLLPFVLGSIYQMRQLVWSERWPILITGFFGITCYNALQYLALTTSSPINISLIGASAPVFILVLGRVLFREKILVQGIIGSAVSITGVAWVMTGGQLNAMGTVKFVPGDLFMLMGTFTWSLYTWLIKRRPSKLPTNVLLGAQIVAGLLCSLPLLFLEVFFGGYAPITVNAQVIGIVVYVGMFPSLIAFFCWQLAVGHTSPHVPVLFMNLTPVFTVLLSALALDMVPQTYHLVGLVLILLGIWLARPVGRSGKA
jgi:drug/metabolite transporter (DMT)-like permease